MQHQTSNIKPQMTKADTNYFELMRNWCAYQERCQQDARDKLFDLGLKTAEVEDIVASLIAEQFIDEERYAIAFASGKFRIKKWGKVKIRSILKMKRVSDYSVRKALSEIDEEEYLTTLRSLIESKAKMLKSEPNKIRKNYKLLRFAQSRGFETDLIMNLLKN